MDWLLACKARLLALFRGRRMEAELDEELQAHLEMLIEENRQRGLPPHEARRAALLALGGLEQTREAHREARGFPRLEALARDVRFGLRSLGRSRGFTVVVVLTLALGIGANTAVFQLVDALRLRRLPVPDPDGLAEVRIVGGGGMGVTLGPYAQLTGPLWRALAAHQQALAGLFAWNTDWVPAGATGEANPVRALWVSGDFFRTLGVQPARGRLLDASDETRTCPSPVAVVSEGFWRARLGGQPLGAVSRLVVGGIAREVVGVTPAAFTGLAVGESFDVVLPLCGPQERRHVFDLSVMGRLKPGWTLERASAYLGALGPGLLAATTPDQYSAESIERYRSLRLGAVSAATGVSRLRGEYDASLALLLGITGLVLLIACANLANLMLARAARREHELAVRVALGAGRGRLFQQLLVESALLAALGAGLGLVLAGFLGQALLWCLSTTGAPVSLALETDGRVLAFAAATAVLTCGLFGALPAWRATRTQPAAALRASGPGLSAGGGRFAAHRLITVAQLAVSLVLLFGALLFVRSFRNLIRFDPGMRQQGISVALVDFSRAGLPAERFPALRTQLLEEVRGLPGVLDAATTTHVPLLGSAWSHEFLLGPLRGGARFTWVSAGYFRTMGIPLVAGRVFDDATRATSVVVVNRSFVERYLAGGPVLGRTFTTLPEPGYPARTLEIVGVVADTRYNNLRGPREPIAFEPAAQLPAPAAGAKLLIHASVPPAVIMQQVRRKVAEHPGLTVRLVDFQAQIREGLVRERLMALVSGFFGLLAAVLVSVGVYGVTALLVARRRKEIGIRRALGASTARTAGLLARELAVLLALGTAIGAGISLVAARATRSLLFGLAPDDVATLLGAGALLALIAALATAVPARRALGISPMVALRED